MLLTEVSECILEANFAAPRFTEPAECFARAKLIQEFVSQPRAKKKAGARPTIFLAGVEGYRSRCSLLRYASPNRPNFF